MAGGLRVERCTVVECVNDGCGRGSPDTRLVEVDENGRCCKEVGVEEGGKNPVHSWSLCYTQRGCKKEQGGCPLGKMVDLRNPLRLLGDRVPGRSEGCE
ncbi:MAG: hypothetical protein WC686_03605 [Candidatus Shapirobacteria bacterium]